MATIILIVTNYVARSYLKRKSINFAHGSGNKVRCAQGSKTEGVYLMIGRVRKGINADTQMTSSRYPFYSEVCPQGDYKSIQVDNGD